MITLTLEDLRELRRALNNRTVILVDRYKKADSIDTKEEIDDLNNQLEKTRTKINSLIVQMKNDGVEEYSI